MLDSLSSEDEDQGEDYMRKRSILLTTMFVNMHDYEIKALVKIRSAFADMAISEELFSKYLMGCMATAK